MEKITQDQRAEFVARFKKLVSGEVFDADTETVNISFETEIEFEGVMKPVHAHDFVFPAGPIFEDLVQARYAASKVSAVPGDIQNVSEPNINLLVELGAKEDNCITPVLSVIVDGFVAVSYEFSQICPPFCP